MNLRSLAVAGVTGLAAFLAVSWTITDFARPWVEVSVFLGVPGGIVAGAFVAALVYLGLADDVPDQRRRVAAALASFGVAFLAVLLAVGALLELDETTALVVAAVVGVLTAASAYVGGGGGPTDVRAP